jgi:serine/threonine protein kinase
VELAEREARVLQSIEHELLPRYVDHFEEDGALHTVMTLVAGEDLRALCRRGERFSTRDVLQLLGDAAASFEYLHGHSPPIVHRDIKPSNIVRGLDGKFRFVDFGSVTWSLRPEGGSTVVGTFGYMAPEQFQGRAGIGSDIYSLGATALMLLTGSEPEALPHVGLGIDVRRALGSSADPRLRSLLHAMLEPNPDRRPTSLARLLAQTPAREAGVLQSSRARSTSPRPGATALATASRNVPERSARRIIWLLPAGFFGIVHGLPGLVMWIPLIFGIAISLVAMFWIALSSGSPLRFRGLRSYRREIGARRDAVRFWRRNRRWSWWDWDH